MKPVKRKGTLGLLKLLKGIEGTPEHKELLQYISRLEENEKNLFGLLKTVQLPDESFQLEYDGFDPVDIQKVF